MRPLIILGVLIAALTTFSASANDQVPAAPSGPCTRGPSQIKMGGIDLDVARCQIALDAQRMGELQGQINATLAALQLANVDLAAAKKAADDAQAEIAGWREYAKPLYDLQK